MDRLSINFNPDYIKVPKPWWRARGFWTMVAIAFFVGFIAFKVGLAYNTIVVDNTEQKPWWNRVANVLPFINFEPEPTPDPNPAPKPEPDRLDILILGIKI